MVMMVVMEVMVMVVKREMKFTPGPWEVVTEKEVLHVYGDFDADADDDGRTTYFRTRVCEIADLGDEAEEANAYLISAATGMYAALVEVEWSDGGRCPQCGRGRESGEHQPQCVLGEALAKAEGRRAAGNPDQSFLEQMAEEDKRAQQE